MYIYINICVHIYTKFWPQNDGTRDFAKEVLQLGVDYSEKQIHCVGVVKDVDDNVWAQILDTSISSPSLYTVPLLE
jgi:hypothetical protein